MLVSWPKIYFELYIEEGITQLIWICFDVKWCTKTDQCYQLTLLDDELTLTIAHFDVRQYTERSISFIIKILNHWNIKANNYGLGSLICHSNQFH